MTKNSVCKHLLIVIIEWEPYRQSITQSNKLHGEIKPGLKYTEATRKSKWRRCSENRIKVLGTSWNEYFPSLDVK